MKHSPPTRKPATAATPATAETVEMSLILLERLAGTAHPLGISDLAREYGTSKTKIYRHLQALVRQGFVRQDALTRRYEAGIKLFVLGERLRERFDIVAVARDEMAVLRDRTGQAVTLSTLVDDQVVVLDVFHGHALVDFGTRPGTILDLHATAHGKVALAFGPPDLVQRCTRKPLKALTPQTISSAAGLERAITQVRKRGWATAPNEALIGVNGVAAPIFDHQDRYAGAVAIVGSVQHIAANPSPAHVAAVTAAAGATSRRMGAPRA